MTLRGMDGLRKDNGCRLLGFLERPVRCNSAGGNGIQIHHIKRGM